jgi:threonine dehydrogenase-like Zn-dependent dehydrogenase
MQAAFAHVAHGGTYVLISVVKDTITFTHPEFHKREMTLKGSRNATRADFERVMQGMREGVIPTAALNTHAATLAEVPEAMPRWIAERSQLVKALVTV